VPSISFPSPARSGGRVEIRCVGEENLTGGNTTRIPTVAPQHGPIIALWKMAQADDSIRLAVIPNRPMTSTTELTVLTGERYRIEGDPKEVERIIVDAARGSIMQLAWLVEAETGQALAVNPDHVVALRGTHS
jgi:hypothetical protein